MSYLLNNPFIILVIVLLVGVVVFVGMKIYNEITLNNMLKHKKASMRVGDVNPGFTKRIGILGSTVLAPVLVIALILVTGTKSNLIPTGNLSAIHNSNDIVEIYNEFSSRLDASSGFSKYLAGFVIQERSSDTLNEEAVLFGASYELTADVTNDSGSEGSDDYSDTNNQVIGVDEMDNVVTDGKYIYTIDGNQVIITLAYTQALEEEALSLYKKLDFIEEVNEACPEGFVVSGMYVDDDYLVVVGSTYRNYCEDDGENEYVEYGRLWWGYYYQTDVSVYVFDKTDDFSLESTYEVSGSLIGTRKIGDDLYIVTTSYIPFDQEDFEIEEYIPYYVVGSTKVNADYEDITYVEGVKPNAFTSFYALDLDHEQVDVEVVLGDAGYNLYVSENNIYLVGNIYYFTPLTAFVDTDDQVSETKTAIMKVAINGADLEYVTTGVIAGYTLNQFSMDEYEGNLRIATTTGNWGNSINNRLFILDENLEEISKLENIGKPGELIRSVRFTGEYGYIVTFEQTDPFYVINLSDPANPVKEGELEIPGFSTYLQPLGEDFMLGIGFGDSNGGTQGIKISVYDIRDKSNPVVFDEVIFDYADFGYSSTSVTYNHKDLLVSLSKGLIALPFTTYDWNEEYGREYNSGILVYDFNETDGLTFKGYVQHEVDTVEEIYVYKSKFISDFFYTISNKYIKVSTIEDPETILKEVLLIDAE